MGGLSLLLGLLLLLLALTSLGAALGLEILVVDGQSLVDLGAQSAVVLKPARYELANCSERGRDGYVCLQVNQLGVVHLQQHAGDLAS